MKLLLIYLSLLAAASVHAASITASIDPDITDVPTAVSTLLANDSAMNTELEAATAAVAAVPAVIDEDNLSTDSATRPPSQQSVKAYADAIAAAKANISHTHTAANVTDFSSAVAATASVTANTNKLILVRTVVDLTDGATVALDASLGQTYRVTLGGNRTLAPPSNPTDGQVIELEITQDGTGSRTLTLPTGAGGVRFGTDAPSGLFVLSTTADKTDYLTLKYREPDDRWDVLSFIRGY